MSEGWRVLPSARKHGQSDEDIRHAIRNARRVIDLDDDQWLYLGADAAGRVLEVVVVIDDDPRVVHAMPLRRSWQQHL